jgi:hypothetical protein
MFEMKQPVRHSSGFFSPSGQPAAARNQQPTPPGVASPIGRNHLLPETRAHSSEVS